MNKREAAALAQRIVREDPRCLVAGTRWYGVGRYGLEVQDNRTGYRFVVDGPEQWDERRREAALYA